MKIRCLYRAFLLWLVAVACSSPLLAAAPLTLHARGSSWPQRLHVRSDFDGDQVPDTAIVRRHGTRYTLSIHFSGKASKVFRTYYTSEPVIGITSLDVDGDRDRDIVLLGLNSVVPAGLWVNEGRVEFVTQAPWLAAVVQKNSDVSLSQGFSEGQDPDPGNLTEPGPDASVPESFVLAVFKSESGLSAPLRRVPLSGLSVSVPSRGPPLNF